MIRAFGLTKRFGEKEVVSDLSFSIEAGEVVGLLGPNGAGKTTTMRMLTTFLPPSSGTAQVAGFGITEEAEQVRRAIGYLPETPPLYPEMRVSEYLQFVAAIKGVEKKKVCVAVEEVLALCGLEDSAAKLCGTLSKGYRQRVGLAASLAHRPPVLILDEPTSGLDPAQILEIRELICSLRGKHTVVLSTHILPEVQETCSRVLIISNGKIATEGSVEQLTKEHSLEEEFLRAVAKPSFTPASEVLP